MKYLIWGNSINEAMLGRAVFSFTVVLLPFLRLRVYFLLRASVGLKCGIGGVGLRHTSSVAGGAG